MLPRVGALVALCALRVASGGFVPAPKATRLGALVTLCALRAASGGIVLAPETNVTTGLGRELPATSLRFFGKRRFHRNITGEVVRLYGEQQCDRRMLPRPPVLKGAIVVLEYLTAARGLSCALETVYTNLNGAGAALVLLPRRANPPGVTYNFHDGSRGRRTRGEALLMLEMFKSMHPEKSAAGPFSYVN